MSAASGTSATGRLAQTDGLRVRVHAADLVRRRGLVAMLQAAGHSVTDETPDVELCDVGHGEQPVPHEAEAPVVALSVGPTIVGMPAGMLAADATADQLDLALRAVSAGLLVRSPGLANGAVVAQRGFAPAGDEAPPLLTPREREILALVGQGLSNKSVARQLGISIHTVKFHLEALFAKLDATSRAEAVAKGLRGGVIVL
jgi:two-component system, NarL family, nitrate/nitrite response regulator NarL